MWFNTYSWVEVKFYSTLSYSWCFLSSDAFLLPWIYNRIQEQILEPPTRNSAFQQWVQKRMPFCIGSNCCRPMVIGFLPLMDRNSISVSGFPWVLLSTPLLSMVQCMQIRNHSCVDPCICQLHFPHLPNYKYSDYAK